MRRAILKCRTLALSHPCEDSVEVGFTFPSTFLGFTGHFPTNPILPAIVQILTGQTIIDEWVGNRTTLYTVKSAKFLDAVGPDQPLQLHATRKSEGVYAFIFSRSDGGIVSKFTLECR